MKGRQTIGINRSLTLDDLVRFFGEHWDREAYNAYRVGDPALANAPAKYVILPATDNWCTIVYPKTGGLLKKKPTIVLSSAYTSDGAQWLGSHGPRMMRHTVEEGVRQSRKAKALNAEMGGEAEEYLLWYTAYLRELLAQAGLLA